ncbi:hypothetical protein TIFTF001_045106 [Ficus carica]|uniref:Uncharacterized protein n=1 Tax=Ficus carica TaxID=3494 RepID=A0AA87Z6V5_FICCA|nr:hypothetical protein TIFTF001_045106 [Ficus carica]
MSTSHFRGREEPSEFDQAESSQNADTSSTANPIVVVPLRTITVPISGRRQLAHMKEVPVQPRSPAVPNVPATETDEDVEDAEADAELFWEDKRR